MDWIVSPQIDVEVLTPDVTIFGDKTCNQVVKVKWGQKGRLYTNGTGFLVRRGRNSRSEHTEKSPCEETGIRQPSASPGAPKPTDTLILDFQTPELLGNKFSLLKPSNLWYFVMIAIAN